VFMPSDCPDLNVSEVRQLKAADESLQQKCVTASEKGSDVVVAVRKYPNDSYDYFYQDAEIVYVQSKLRLLGYSVETKTVMDSKCSKLVLIVEKNTICIKQVKAERLK
jgi:hypothetical protein